MRITCAAVLALLWLPALARADAYETRVRTAVDAEIAKQRLDARHVDTDDILERMRAASGGAGSQAEFEARIRSEVARSHMQVGPPDAIHHGSYRYALPYPPVIPYYLAQGVGGEGSHQIPENYHAFDFSMVVGSEVRAAREGTVARVVDGFGPSTPGDTDPDAVRRANRVVILHSDGTFATYLHLQKGVLVQPDQTVKRGQPIARSGMSGAPFGPHLHFAVAANTRDGGFRTVPIRFGRRNRPGFVPETGQFVGSELRTTAALQASLDGTPLVPDRPLAVPRGHVGQLKIELTDGLGRKRDVTTDPNTHIDIITPWSVRLEEGARLRMEKGPEFGHMKPVDKPLAIVQIRYQEHAKRVHGRALVTFEIGG